MQPSLADPQGSSPLFAAVTWLGDTLLGTIATSIAVVAIAAIGLSMLNGRIDARRALTVILGCFILFGARDIVTGIVGLVSGGGDTSDAPRYTQSIPVPAQMPARPIRPDMSDPYAGASVPFTTEQ